MRKYVYYINCKDKIGVWDGIREQWDRIYVDEYAIRSKKVLGGHSTRPV
jgi:hypothetical protein